MTAFQDIQNRVSAAELRDFCARHHIVKLAVFGSVARGEDTPDSDLDILVEFAPGKTPGFAYFGIEEELTHMFGRKVDLHTPLSINARYRGEVLQEAQTVYDARP